MYLCYSGIEEITLGRGGPNGLSLEGDFKRILPPSIIGSLNVKSKISLLNSSLSIFKANTIDDKPVNNKGTT